VTTQVEDAEKLVVVRVEPEIEHPGLVVAKLTAPLPEPPTVPRVKLELTSLVTLVLEIVKGSWLTISNAKLLAAEVMTL
jgi:hypothetical protein